MLKIRQSLMAIGAALALAFTGLTGATTALAAPTGPSIEVTPAPREGGQVTITGSGFSTTGPGVYVGIGPANEDNFYSAAPYLYGNDPSADMTQNPSSRWVYTPAMATMAKSINSPLVVPMQADGSFTLTLNSPAYKEGENWAVFVSKAHGQGKSDPSSNVKVALTYAPAAAGEKQPEPTSPEGKEQPQPTQNPNQDKQPAQPTQQAPAPAESQQAPATNQVDAAQQKPTSGSLVWGLRSSFTNYIRTIAHGKWELGGGVTWNGKDFVFPIRSGLVNTNKKAGTLNYSGSVHFTGHNGVLDLTISNPSLEINGNKANLYLTVAASDMEGKHLPVVRSLFATAQLSQAQLANGQYKLVASSVQLTAEGAKAFAGFYQAGEALNTFTASGKLAQATATDLAPNASSKHVKGKASLANSGAHSTALAGLAALLLASGFSLTYSRRRANRR